MNIHLVTIFPHIFDSYLRESIMKRASAKKRVRFLIHDIRQFSKDKHNKVDARPYGGGAGMVMQVGPIVRAIRSIVKRKSASTRVILLSAKGSVLTQSKVRALAKIKTLILIAGHYEGVDERVTKYVDEELSVGEYVVTGGELPALVVADAVVRLLPGVLGDDASHKDESHEVEGVLEYPQYTRPEIFESGRVPRVLLSGDHKKITAWRNKHRKRL